MARQHGTRSCYVGGCRRPECCQAQAEWRHAYYQICKPYLHTKNVDPCRAADHIAALRAGGMGVDSIARASGVRKNTIWWIARGQRPTGIRRATEEKILRVSLMPEWVDCTGTRRRLQALAALGHTFEKVAAEVGVHQRTVSKLACGQETVRRVLAERVAHVYDAWSMMSGPSARNRTYAHTKGWTPPLAWDEETIDDPTASPVHTDPGVRSKLDLDEWWMLVTAGEDPQRAADRCGVLIGTVERAAQRAGRKDLAAAAAAARHQARWGTAA